MNSPDQKVTLQEAIDAMERAIKVVKTLPVQGAYTTLQQFRIELKKDLGFNMNLRTALIALESMNTKESRHFLRLINDVKIKEFT